LVPIFFWPQLLGLFGQGHFKNYRTHLSQAQQFLDDKIKNNLQVCLIKGHQMYLNTYTMKSTARRHIHREISQHTHRYELSHIADIVLYKLFQKILWASVFTTPVHFLPILAAMHLFCKSELIKGNLKKAL